jgi:hypothetical protein
MSGFSLIKARVCDLKEGDEFSYNGAIRYRVINNDGDNLVCRWIDKAKTYNATGWNEILIGCRSQRFVYLLKKHDHE